MEQRIVLILVACMALVSPFCDAAAYQCPSHIPPEEWEEILPYLLPRKHKIKKQLDRVFAFGDVLHDEAALDWAGFHLLPRTSPRHCYVARHPLVKGALLKLYTDTFGVTHEWGYWLKRIRGAEVIRSRIALQGYEELFSVPKKWLYLVPNAKRTGQTIVLVVEKMHLRSNEKNRKLWRKKMTTEQLDALYDMLQPLGLFDSVSIDNIPYCHDGTIAFIDTEHFFRWPVRLEQLAPYLNEKNARYWKSLIENKGAAKRLSLSCGA